MLSTARLLSARSIPLIPKFPSPELCRMVRWPDEKSSPHLAGAVLIEGSTE